MKSLVIGLVLCLPLSAMGQSFSVSFPKDVSAQALDGRVLLVLSTDPSDEPRNQIDDTPRTQMVFGVTVDGWKPGEATVVDAGAWGYPVLPAAYIAIAGLIEVLLLQYKPQYTWWGLRIVLLGVPVYYARRPRSRPISVVLKEKLEWGIRYLRGSR